MFNNRFLIPIIAAVSAITIGGAALAYNMSKPKENKVVQNNVTNSIISATSSQSSVSSTSKNTTTNSSSSTSSSNSSNSNSNADQTESKNNENKTENQNQAAANEVANLNNGNNNSKTQTKQFSDYKPADNCSLPDKDGFDVLLTNKGCLYFEQKFERQGYPWQWSQDFKAKDRAKLTKALQDIAGIQYDKYVGQMRNKNATLEIRGYNGNGQNSIAIGFNDQGPDIATDWFNYAAYYNLNEGQNGNWSYGEFDPMAKYGCTLSPTPTTQIVQTQYRCLEFPKDMFSDSNYSFLNSFGARNKSKLQEAVIQATVEFYEANYPRSLVKFPNIKTIEGGDKTIYFNLSDTPVDCNDCGSSPINAYKFYKFSEQQNESWTFTFEVCQSVPDEVNYPNFVKIYTSEGCFNFDERFDDNPNKPMHIKFNPRNRESLKIALIDAAKYYFLTESKNVDNKYNALLVLDASEGGIKKIAIGFVDPQTSNNNKAKTQLTRLFEFQEDSSGYWSSQDTGRTTPKEFTFYSL